MACLWTLVRLQPLFTLFSSPVVHLFGSLLPKLSTIQICVFHVSFCLVSQLLFHPVPGALVLCFRAAQLHLLLSFYLIYTESNSAGIYFLMMFLGFFPLDFCFLAKALRLSRFPLELQLFLTSTSTAHNQYFELKCSRDMFCLKQIAVFGKTLHSRKQGLIVWIAGRCVVTCTSLTYIIYEQNSLGQTKGLSNPVSFLRCDWQ